MKLFYQLEPQLRRSLLALFVAGLLFWASICSLLPTLPLYVQEVAGTKQQIGMVMGSFAIGLLLCRPILGKLADDRSRKLVLLIGVAVVAIAPLGYLVVKSIPLLIMLRAFHGISIAAFTTGFTALVADLSPPKQRGELIGYMGLAYPIGSAIGPAIGGFVQAEYGYPPLFMMSFALGMVGWFCAYQLPEITHETEHRPAPSQEKTSFWRLLATDRLRIPFVVMFMIGWVFGVIFTFVPLFIQENNIDLNAGLFFTAGAIVSFSVRILIGGASDRYGRGLFITGSLACYMISMVMLYFAHSSTELLLAASIQGVGGGVFLPTMLALMTDRSHPKERGQAFSLCFGGLDLGIALAGPVLGYVADLQEVRFLFAIAVGLAVTALVSFLTLSSKDLPHSLKFAFGRTKDIYALSE